MAKTVLLLTPVYISVFWAFILNFYPSLNHAPKRFLGKFMVACVIIYLTHFFYYTPYPNLVAYIDPLYQLASLLAYPLYYIYIRLLCAEKKFSWQRHKRYLLPSIILFLLYLVGAIALPHDVFENWIYHKGKTSDLPLIGYMNMLSVVIRMVFIIQVALALIGNYYLIRKYRFKGVQFYSDIQESNTISVEQLNGILIVCAVSSITLSVFGRIFFISEIAGITAASIIFSSMLFLIGWIGMQQKAINPAYEDYPEEATISLEELPLGNRQHILEKINYLFKYDRIYLNSKLNIQDVAQTVGTNRTYVSSIINQKFGVNFCSFVNNYRIEELENILSKHPDLTNQILAETCGFGSVDSLKRAVFAKTGLSISEWKANIPVSRKNRAI
jgi:AraC-like DNA-binding protein